MNQKPSTRPGTDRPFLRSSMLLLAAALCTAHTQAGPLPQPDPTGLDVSARRQLADARDRATRALATGDEEARATAWGELGREFQAYDRLDAARECYVQAGLLAPRDARWPYLLGTVQRRAGRPGRARASFRRSIELDPSYMAAHVRLGQLERIADRLDDAAARFTAVIERDSAHAAARVELARVHLARREYAAASQQLDVALERAPWATEAAYLRSLARRGTGDAGPDHDRHANGSLPVTLVDERLAGVRRLTGGKRYYQRLASEHFRAGRVDRALAELLREVDASPDDAGVRLDLGLALQALSDHAGAVHVLERAIELDGRRAAAHDAVATSLGWLGRDEEAVRHYRRALELDPGLGEARFQLANALRRLGRFEDAAENYAAAAAALRAHAPSRLGEALALIRLHRDADARRRLESALAEFPDDRGIRQALVRLLAASADEGVRDGMRAVELGQPLLGSNARPDHVVAMAMVAAETGDFETAKRFQRRALEWFRRSGRSGALPKLEADLALYEAGKPCRRAWDDADALLAPGPLEPPRGPASMVRLLARVALDVDPSTNVFENDLRAERLIGRIASAGKLSEQQILRFERAQELLRSNRPEEAIELTRAIIETHRSLGADETGPDMVNMNAFLALAYMRKGEQDNCIERHAAESCLMPIEGDGVHVDPSGSRSAIEIYRRLLAIDGENLEFRWLLNLAHMTLGQYPGEVNEAWLIPPEAFASPEPFARFTDLAGPVGVDVNALAGGSIVEDFDGDGLLDLMASSWGPLDQMRLFRNEGDGTFADWTERAGLLGQFGGLNMVHADYDNDGWADVLVVRGGWWPWGLHPNSLLRNNGDGSFTDVTRRAGLVSFHPTQAAAWADFNRDGWLDLFLGNESMPGNVHRSELYVNNGDGTFREAATEFGLGVELFVKGATWGDYDNDGWPDLYLSQHDGDNVLFHNDGPREGGGWWFSDVTATAGVAGPKLSFPTWFWDYDNDGWQDILAASFASYLGNSLEIVVADYLGQFRGETSALYRNNRDGTFTDVAADLGLGAALLAMGANYGDVDNDGYLDCYFATGQPRMNVLVPNRMYRNAGGEKFNDVTTAGGFGHLQKGHGIAFGDVDNDGDQDLYAVMGGAFSGDTFQNALFVNPGNENHWITLRLVGERANRSAIGTRIKLTLESARGQREVHVTVGTGGSFGSSSLQQEIGLGDATAIRSIEIDWAGPQRAVQTVTGVPLDRIVELREGARPVVLPPTPAVPLRRHAPAGAEHHHP